MPPVKYGSCDGGISKKFYGPKVLIGNWAEARSEYIKKDFPRYTFYQTDFVPQDIDMENQKIAFYDNKMRNAGELNCSQQGDERFNKNMTTVYDIIYSKAGPGPSVRCSKYNRRPLGGYVSKEDLMENYGNLTEFGLQKFKKMQWNEEREQGRDIRTVYQKDFNKKELPSEKRRIRQKYNL